MSYKFADLKLKTPYISASGCWGYGWEGHEYFSDLKWGAVTTKTITLDPRQGNDPPRIFESGTGIINRIGLQNCGLDSFMTVHLPRLKNIPYKVIASIFGNTKKEWEMLVKTLSDTRIDAFELNLSCPNIKGRRLVENINKSSSIATALAGLTDKPLIAKIGALDEPLNLSRALSESGIKGIVCSNTLPAAFLYEGSLYYGGLSGPPIKPVVLKAVNIIKSELDIDVAACGGIRTLKDIDDYRVAGADAYVLGSVLFSNPEAVNELF